MWEGESRWVVAVTKYKIEIRVKNVKKGEPKPVDFEVLKCEDGELIAFEKLNKSDRRKK